MFASTPQRLVLFAAEDSPSGLGRTLGKRVGGNPSRVRISYPPPVLSPGTLTKGSTGFRSGPSSLSGLSCLSAATSGASEPVSALPRRCRERGFRPRGRSGGDRAGAPADPCSRRCRTPKPTRTIAQAYPRSAAHRRGVERARGEDDVAGRVADRGWLARHWAVLPHSSTGGGAVGRSALHHAATASACRRSTGRTPHPGHALRSRSPPEVRRLRLPQ